MGPDFVKVVPCAQVGGDSYIRALKAMFPNVPLIAAGGVNQQTASGFISGRRCCARHRRGVNPQGGYPDAAARSNRRVGAPV